MFIMRWTPLSLHISFHIAGLETNIHSYFYTITTINMASESPILHAVVDMGR